MAEAPARPVSLVETLDRLAGIESAEFPVVSLYLDMRADERGRDHFWPFVRKELAGRTRTYPPRSGERESFERDAEKIERYLRDELKPSADGVAIFACSGGGGLFEALQLDAAFAENRLTVGNWPHLYPLARLIDENPRFAVLLADTKLARIVVFARGRNIGTETVENEGFLKRTRAGGWSQMRYQRHADEHQAKHAKEAVAALERVVREDRIAHVLLAGDEIILPLLKEELGKPLAALVVDSLHLDIRADEREIVEAARRALSEHDAKTDAEKVGRLLDEYRAGGLGVVGAEDTLAALGVGQVDELLISAALAPPAGAKATGAPAPNGADEERLEAQPERAGGPAAELADELVRLARQTSGKVTFIEDPALLSEVGGVGGFLRYRLTGTGLEKRS